MIKEQVKLCYIDCDLKMYIMSVTPGLRVEILFKKNILRFYTCYKNKIIIKYA